MQVDAGSRYGMFYKNKKEKGRLKKEGYKYRVPTLW